MRSHDAFCSYLYLFSFLLFFFFQAEDGIRDHCVTGVQTCALPISSSPPARQPFEFGCRAGGEDAKREQPVWLGGHRPLAERSEERRVGKECRSRWSPQHQKKKNN